MDNNIKGQLLYEIMCHPDKGIFIRQLTNGKVNSKNILNLSMSLVVLLKKNMKIIKILDGVIHNVILNSTINVGEATLIVPRFIPHESHFVVNNLIYNDDKFSVDFKQVKGPIDSEVILRLIVNMLQRAKKDAKKFIIMIELYKTIFFKKH
jgi:uncharacterized membrane protein